MRHHLKLVLTVLILGAALFVLGIIFDFNFSGEVCPPSQCVFSKNGQLAVGTETGRTREDFSPAVPPGLPSDLPIDFNPLQVLGSYQETMEGDKKEGELSHTQITYIYTSEKQSGVIMAGFEKYFKNKGFKVTFSENELSLSAEKTFELATVTVATQNQFERLVTVSLIFTEKISQK